MCTNFAGAPTAPTIVDLNVASDGPAQLLQPLQKSRKAGLIVRITLSRAYQHADPPHAPRLLGVRSQRPRCCANQNTEKCPPPHGPSPLRSWHRIGSIGP